MHTERVSAPRAVGCEEPKVWGFGGLRSLDGDILMLGWDWKMAVEERVALDKREGVNLLENKQLAAEVKRLEEGRVLT